MSFDIGEVLARAWQITWKHRVLWLFNMLPVLLGFLFIPVVLIPMFFLGPNSLIHQEAVDQPFYISLFLAFNLLLTVLSLLLYTAGAAGASLGILRVENGREQLYFRDLFQDGLEYFWRILAVLLAISAGVFALFLLLFGLVMLVGMATLGLAMICLQPLFLLIYPAALLLYALTELSQAGIIADHLGVVDALSRGWALIKAHFWRFVMVSLVIYFGIFLLSCILMIPLMAPFFFLPLVAQAPQAGGDLQPLGWALMALSLILLPVLALVQGVSMTFMKSAFMVIYLRLTRSTVVQTALK